MENPPMVIFPSPFLGTKVTTTLPSFEAPKSSNNLVIPNVRLVFIIWSCLCRTCTKLPANSDLSGPLGESASSFTYTSNLTGTFAGNSIPRITSTSSCFAFSTSLRFLTSSGLATSTLMVESKVAGNLVESSAKETCGSVLLAGKRGVGL
ncbi:hypothetical protein PRUPE_4G041600 [Prunus persica]|uniref:Uncharacterized protein n=1 Tax=Prunus persica TaxID=3760 RepID=A0A251PFI1_PRUPE|nr:hypothetical protein PRUPE_4G041600 [Prunus persica]